MHALAGGNLVLQIPLASFEQRTDVRCLEFSPLQYRLLESYSSSLIECRPLEGKIYTHTF